MVIISDKTTQNTIKIPANFAKKPSNSYKLKLTSGVNKKEYEFSVTDSGTSSSFFYTFSVSFAALPFGEYDYVVTDTDDNAQGEGIIRLESGLTRTIYDTSIDFKTYDITL